MYAVTRKHMYAGCYSPDHKLLVTHKDFDTIFQRKTTFADRKSNLLYMKTLKILATLINPGPAETG